MLNKLLTTIPLFIMLVLADVFIGFAAGSACFQLLSERYSDNISAAVSILIAVGTIIYIRFNHKIRELFNRR